MEAVVWAPEQVWTLWLNSNDCSYGQFIVTTLTELLRYCTSDTAYLKSLGRNYE